MSATSSTSSTAVRSTAPFLGRLPADVQSIPVERAGAVGGMLSVRFQDGRHLTLWWCTTCTGWHKAKHDGPEALHA